MKMAMSKNLLSGETSPYLLQHADNPVHWRPWGPEALADAKDLNRPIILSIGYAACHWCHVMAHESFENQQTADLMNSLYVNIKVDREERPDLDAIYQRALNFLGQQGGWPLTVFLNPDGEPFWGGTYFPPDSRYGRPGFPDVLKTIHQYWADKPEDITQNITNLRQAISSMSTSASGGELSLEFIERAATRLNEEFDQTHGGIGTAPKFPNPTILELLWRTHIRRGLPELEKTVLLTLDRMCQGGIYDHLGGGFSRYATDPEWLVPHFEKMLYDNALLIDLLVAAWQKTRNSLFARRIRETIEWLEREMIAEDGAFAATLDADSEGEEGKFYVWTETQIDQALESSSPLFKDAYNVTVIGNWEGKTILNRSRQPREFSAPEERELTASRKILLQTRAARIRPGWDDKVLADWNGLMIAALAKAGAVFSEPGWTNLATRAFSFITREMSDGGRLYHSHRSGRAAHAATLEDYANMTTAALALFEHTGEEIYLEQAEIWADTLDQHYPAPGGGYYFTADDAEALIVRTKSAEDHATPAGNAVIAGALAKLWFLTGNANRKDAAEKTIMAFSGEVEKNFFPYAALINAAEFLQCAIQIVIIGERKNPDCASLISAANSVPSPNSLIQVNAPDATLPPLHPAAGKPQINSTATAYVCTGMVCGLPITEPADLERAIEDAASHNETA
jgi:hypothetical protein